MIARLDQEGTLGQRKEIGRTEKGSKFNHDKEREAFYDLDDEFIDDEEMNNQDSMSHVIPHQEFFSNIEEANEKFFEKFKFVPNDKIKDMGNFLKQLK
jgi:hypothetical protein